MKTSNKFLGITPDMADNLDSPDKAETKNI